MNLVKKILFFNIFFLAFALLICEFLSFNYLYGDLREKNFKTREGFITAIQHLRILSYNSPDMSFFDLTLSRYENMDINFDKNFRPLLLFGCSYTYGQGLHKDKNFPSQLQKYTNRKTYSFADLGMEPDHLLKYLYFINNIQIDYNNFQYIIYTFMYDHINRVHSLSLFSEFMNERINKEKNKNIKNKILCLLHKFYTFKLIYNNRYIRDAEIKEEYLKWIMMKFCKMSKEIYPNSKFVLLLYDDITNSTYEFLSNKMKETLQPEYWTELSDNGAIVVSTKDLVGDILYLPQYQLSLDAYQTWLPHHPNEKSWELIVPALSKKLGLNK